MAQTLRIRTGEAILAAAVVLLLLMLVRFGSDLLRCIENHQNWLD